MGTTIHPTAIVDKQCELGDGVLIGPQCVLSGRVKLGPNVQLINGVNLFGPVEIGEGCVLYPGACVGFPAQDYKFKLGMATAGVRIGRECIIREHVTVHAATREDVPTRLGDKVFMMASCHAGHDSKVGNNVILVNGALLAGHSEVQDNAIMSGNTALHQFCRVGRLAFVGGLVAMTKDLPPFCVSGARARMHGLNTVGLRRFGMPREDITLLRRAFWEVLRIKLPRQEMVAKLEELGRDCGPVLELAQFVKESKRGICYDAHEAPEDADVD